MTGKLQIERIGLLALRWPRLLLGVLMVTALFSIYGLSRVSFNSDLREIYRTDSASFANLKKMTKHYSTSENDVLVLVEGGGLLTRPVLGKLRTLHLDLRFVDGVKRVSSIFSARAPPARGKRSRPVIPARIPAGDDLRTIISALQAHPFVGGALLWREGKTALFVVELDQQPAELSQFRDLISKIRRTTGKALNGTGLRATLTGSPVMRLEIIQELFRNQFLFMAIALVFGIGICWLVLRSLRLVLLAVVPTVAAMLMVFGMMALLGQEINVLTNVVPVLVAVIALSDSLHLLFAIRRGMEGGAMLGEAVRGAIEEVGPACVMTSITTAIALSSLLLVPHTLISGFGLAATIGVMLAFLAAIIGVPALAMVCLKNWRPAAPEQAPSLIRAGRWLSVITAGFVIRWPRMISAAGLSLLIVCGFLYFQNTSRYVYREYLPASNAAHQSLVRIDKTLAGASSIRIGLEWPRGADLFSEVSLSAIAKAHRLLAGLPFVRQTWSLHRMLSWMEGGGLTRTEAVAALRGASSRFEGRLISTGSRSAMVVAQFPDRDASLLLPPLRRVEAGLAKLVAVTPGLTAYVTGITTIAAFSVTEMIDLLKRSLLLSVLLIVLVIGVTNRSLGAALVSILPNLLPIVAASACLWVAGVGFQASSVVALVIGFGMAVDSTIHFLNYHRLQTRGPTGQNGLSEVEAVRQTMVALGPVVLMSTLVLVFGLGGTITSNMPTLQLFGLVSVVVLVVALIGDMLVLPATLVLIGLVRSKRSAASPDSPCKPDQ
jgi:predicted RND superfamily exporter protein